MQHTTITVDHGPAWIAQWQDEYCECHYRVHSDGEVKVYDYVAQTFTRCHNLTEQQLADIRACAAEHEPCHDDDDSDLVTVEIMPEHLRESHRAARNFGWWPANGAQRVEVTADEAQDIIDADPDGYAHVID